MSAVAGCAGKTKQTNETEQYFRFNLSTEPETIDPGLMTGSPEFIMALQLFEGLLVNDPETLVPKPGIAASWEISKDGLVYTFHLRKNAKWSNGDPVTARDFLYSWKRVLEPKTASEYVYQLFYIKNAHAYYEGKIKDFGQVGLETIDDYTLKVTLEHPTAYWLDLVAFHTLLPVNQKCVEKYGDKWTRPENIVTDGAFLLKEWVPKDHMILVKNPNYYDAANVKLKKIMVYTVEDLITQLNMFEAGESDWVNTIPLTHVDKYKNRPEGHFTPFLATYYYRFNVTHPPLDDVRVRNALNLSVNKQELCDYVMKSGQKPATTFVPPGIPGYNSPNGPGYDPDKARTLLKQAGFATCKSKGKPFPELTLMYNTSEDHKKVAETIQQMWQKELCIKVQLQNVEWKVYLKNLQVLDYDISRAGWIGDYTDPNTFLDMWVTGGPQNETGWSDKHYDAMISGAANELDPVKRMDILSKAEDYLINTGMPILPINFYVNRNLVKTYVKGMTYNLRDLHPLKYVYIDKSTK
jgi:oligopeptide transport system substrate-binding protein